VNKPLAVFFRIALVLVLLAGCRGSPATPPAPVATPTAAESGLADLLRGGEDLPPVALADALAPPLAVDGPIEVAFDQPMDPDATAGALRVSGPGGAPVDGQVRWPAPDRLVFVPAQPLEPGGAYRVRFDEAAASAKGVALPEPLELTFRAAGALEVSQVFPAPGTFDVAVDSAVTVLFNRPVVPLVIAEEQAGLPQPLVFDPPLEGRGEWVNSSVYLFHPDPRLLSATAFTVTIAGGLADASGEGAPLAADFSWSFTTRPPAVDGLDLPLSEQETIEYGQGGSYPNLPIQPRFSLRFAQPMDPASVEAALAMTSAAGEPVQLELAWSDEDQALAITPAGRLALGTSYNLTLASAAGAADGGRLAMDYLWQFDTIPFPDVLFTRPASGEGGAETFFEIQFASPMKLDTVIKRVVFNPPLEDDNSWYYDSYRNALAFYGLRNSTTYEVSLLAGMEDLAGYSIPTGQVVRFTTRAREPSGWLMLPDKALFRPGQAAEQEFRLDFYARLVNVRSASFMLYRLDLDGAGRYARGEFFRSAPSDSSRVWEQTYQASGAADQLELVKLPLTGPGGEALAPGFYLLAMDSPELVHTGSPFQDIRLVIVGDANLTLKVGPREALAWVTALDSGAPLAGLPVHVYDQQTLRLVGQGRTDADGLFEVELPEGQPQEYPNYLAVVDDGQHFAYAESYWGAGVSLFDYGIWENFYEQPPAEVAYLYTDRPLYRPGQPVYFKGILRLDDDLAYALPERAEVEVIISSFEEEVYRQRLGLSDVGSFDGVFTLDGEAALGSYTLSVRTPGGNADLGSVSFGVAEYRRPEFQVRLATAPADVLAGGTFSGNLAAEYYSGGGLDQARVSWTLRSQPFTFIPPAAYSGYSFTNEDRDAFDYSRGQPPPPDDNLLAEGTGRTDGQGRLTLTLPAELKGEASQRLALEVTVTDLAGSAVSSQAEVVAHRSAVYPGVRFEGYLGREGQEQVVELAALDWSGSPAAGQTVDVRVVERRWNSVQEQDERGTLRWVSQVEEIPVAEFSGVALDGSGQGSVTFTPPNGGVYKAIVTARDGQGNPAEAGALIWVAGAEYIPWRQTNDRGFQLVLDKESYRPGETAEALIASPFQGQAYALVTVERGRIRRQEVVLLDGNSTVYRLPISADLAPNAYLSVVVVKGIDETNPRPSYKIGMAEIKVATDAQQLDVSIQPDRETAGPGEEVTYTIRTTTLDGAPVEAEVSLGLSDLATLSLAPPNARPILAAFYDRRGLRVRTSLALVNSAEEFNAAVAENLNPGGERAGSGGVKGEGAFGVIAVRQDFPDTAFWRADLRTDASGQAVVTVRLPDNLTTWRMDARAATTDTRVGQATHDLRSTKPLLVRPQTTRFFVAGDQATLGAAVHNNTAETLLVDASLAGNGIELLDNAARQVEIGPGRQAYLTWRVQVAEAAELVDLVFSAASGPYSDASRPTIGAAGPEGLPVYRYAAPETVSVSGQLSEPGARTEVVRLPTSMNAVQGELAVTVAPSLSASLADGLSYLEHYPFECTEQTVSRFLPNVLVTRVLREAGQADPELETKLEEQVNLAVQRLSSSQNADGGWGWWQGGESDLQMTAYVLLGLHEARQSGYSVPAAMAVDGMRYLREQAARPSDRFDPRTARGRQALALYVLARYEVYLPGPAGALFDTRQELSLETKALLLQILRLQDAQDPRLDALRSELSAAAVLSASGTHWEEEQADVWNWGSDTRTTAVVLSSLLKTDPASPLLANAVRWLMSHRTAGRWASTQETAWTLMALAEWMQASGELRADYGYALGLNGQPIEEGRAEPGNLQETRAVRLGLDELLAGESNRLGFARGEGAGTLYYTANLTAWLPVPQVQALERGIILSRGYYRLDDPETPVSEVQQGELLRARLTVVVPAALHYVWIDDPLPAGLEAVDSSLLTSPQGLSPEAYRWADWAETGWGWWYFDHVELRDEKVTFAADFLPAGTYIYTYLVRAGTPGAFNVIPPTAQEFYFPEVYGRGEGMLFTVQE
jgi:uncharacterized protein YfaS (alpha-2-macroglobulin family)